MVEKLREALAGFPRISRNDIEFGVDLIDDDDPESSPGDKLGCYYVVSKRKEEAFWLHEIPSSFVCDGTELKILSREHFGRIPLQAEKRVLTLPLVRIWRENGLLVSISTACIDDALADRPSGTMSICFLTAVSFPRRRLQICELSSRIRCSVSSPWLA